jgi:hypothetical protein
MIPTPKQAVALFMAACGATMAQIGAHLGVSTSMAAAHVKEARYKAKCAGIRVIKDKPQAPKGFATARELAKEAGLIR